MMVNFFLPMVPPTVTHQEHEFKIVHGKVVVYEPPRLKDARQMFMARLAGVKHRDPGWDYVFPIDGPIRLVTKWIFPTDDNHGDGEWKITPPDTDNLIKLFKDCMTRCHYWHDDAQVCSEITEKFYGDRSGIYVRIEPITQNDDY